MAGAAGVGTYYAMLYAGRDPLAYGGHSYTEPYGSHMSTTYWKISDTSSDTSDGYRTELRNWEMYMAESVDPPGFSSPGIDYFNSYPTTGGTLSDARLAINWEQTGHSSTNGFYEFHSGAGTESAFLSNVKLDISYGMPTLLTLYTDKSIGGTVYHLPNWNHNVGHAISIIGYNDQDDMYTYIDTLGTDGNTSPGNLDGATYNTTYNTMYQLMHSFGEGYLY